MCISLSVTDLRSLCFLWLALFTGGAQALQLSVNNCVPPAAEPDREQLYTDDFETNSLAGWTTTGTVSTTGAAAFEGTYGARLTATSSIEQSYDFSGYRDIYVDYARRPVGLDSTAGEILVAQWYDGVDWNTLESVYIDYTGWKKRSFALPSYADNNANFKLRFTLNANSNAEYGYVDDIDISGVEIAVASGTGLQGSFESKYKRYQQGQSFKGFSSNVWHDAAWKNERISKQLVLWTDTALSGLGFTVNDLSSGANTIDSSNITLHFQAYAKADKHVQGDSQTFFPPSACSSHNRASDPYTNVADILTDDAATTLGTSDPLKIWLEVNVPASTVAGTYTGTIEVAATGQSTQVFTLDIEVIDRTLPDVDNWAFHLDIWQFPMSILYLHNAQNPGSAFSAYSQEHMDALEPAYRLLADMGQKAITTYIKHGALGEPSMVEWVRKTNGTWEYDFTVFDNFVNTLESWGIDGQINAFSILGWNETILPYWDEATNSQRSIVYSVGDATFTTRWNHFLTAFKAHLDVNGWFDKTVIYMDENSRLAVQSAFDLIEAHNAHWKKGVAQGRWLPNALRSRMYDNSVLLEAYVDPGLDRTGKVTTFYTSCFGLQPNNLITADSNPAENTWMAWHAVAVGFNGYLRWAFDNWKKSDFTDARVGSNSSGDFAQVYESSHTSPIGVYSSIRAELLRDGIQDFEKIEQLKLTLNSCELNLLNTEVAKFSFDFNDDTMNSNATKLVLEAKQLLLELSKGTACP